MSKKAMTSVPFKGTPEQETELRKIIDTHRHTKGALMPILQKAQDVYGYLPSEVQKIVSDETGVPLAEIYGVVTFYTQFNLNPKGKYMISVCMGTACYVKGAGGILEEIGSILNLKDGGCTPDNKFSLDATRCLGCCGLAPVMTVNEDVYGNLKKEEIAAIIKKY